MDRANVLDDTELILSWGVICARCKGPRLRAGSQPAAKDIVKILKGQNRKS